MIEHQIKVREFEEKNNKQEQCLLLLHFHGRIDFH